MTEYLILLSPLSAEADADIFGGADDAYLAEVDALCASGDFLACRSYDESGNEFYAIADLTDLVPIDAARFFFNMREPNSTLDFDLDLAVEESSQNPVYYVQYAHARICSILKNLTAQNIHPRTCTLEELQLLSAPEEKELIRKLAQCPQEIINAAKNYDPARMTHYLMDVATLFHKFYNACRVQGEDEKLMQARISLCLATRVVLANLLKLLKITAPESM